MPSKKRIKFTEEPMDNLRVVKTLIPKNEFFELQRYGAKKVRKLKLTEKVIEKLIFEDR
ncbi:MAG: hypothetical protein FD156_1940 [Nitrospirae bacterium]|nr:MAG: hypothetical protein FD156_1940 [Nitrospirota bacterium]